MQERQNNKVKNIKASRKVVQCNAARDALRHFWILKRGASAEGSTLLPSALRPRLVEVEREDSPASRYHQTRQTVAERARLASIIAAGVVMCSSILGAAGQAAAAQVSLTVPENLNLNVNPGANNGFAETSGTVGVYTNSRGGYSLDIKAKNAANSNKLMNGSDSLESITDAISAEDYKATGPVNSFGFKPSSLNGLVNNNYIAAPTIDGLNIASTSTANLLGQATNYTLGLAAKVDYATPAKAYTNDYVVTAVAGPDGYTNGSDCEVTGLTGKFYAGLCWMWHDYGDYMAASGEGIAINPTTICPNGWFVPNKGQFESLISAVGASSFKAAGWDGKYWTSTVTRSGSFTTFTVLDASSSDAKMATDTVGMSESIDHVRCAAI